MSAAIQDSYAEELSHCYGCGANNPDGMQLKTRWDGDETVTEYLPRPEHTAIPGYVHGGILASLVDCHGTGSAAAAAHRANGHEIGDGTPPRFVTASLQVDFRKPTPQGSPLVARGRIAEQTDRKVVTDVSVTVDGVEVATGRVVAVRMPDGMRPKG
ncbi:PaaI family thioesterase [Mobilicoccus massiliensis]|uniref:PaaI family thioesterase n=1 Tax=Mobilicoccus massiliensis TaxID=1522310 RepID=UPI00058F0D09|nr:PaaI family thioesterase [Mobilicoccus massiliensis]